MLGLPSRTNTRFLQLLLLILFISWLVLFAIIPVVFFPDSESYQATAAHLTDPTSMRPILFPLLLRVTDALHLKQSIVCYLIDFFSLVCLFWICGLRKTLFSATNSGILFGFLLLPAIWSYCGTCLTESILPAVETGIIILLSRLFFPGGKTSLASALLYSVAIALLAILLKPWIMLYVLGCSALFAIISLRSNLFRSVRRSAIILFIVSIVAFAFTYRYNISKSPSSANIGFLLVTSGKVDDLTARLREEKDTTSAEARFIRSMTDDIVLINTRYNGNPYNAPMKDLKVLKVTESAYADTVGKAFRITYLQRGKDVAQLIRLSLHKYIKDIHCGLACLDVCYGPCLPLLQKAGVNSVIFISIVTFLYWFVRWLRKQADSFPNRLSSTGKKRLLFVGVLLFTSIFFSMFLCVAGGVELPRTVLPAVLFQLISLTYLVSNRHDLAVTKQD